MVIDPGTCALIIEMVRPYSERLIDLVFLSPTRPVGHPRFNEDGLAPTLVPLNDVSSMNLHPPIAHLKGLHGRRNGMVAAEYVRHEWSDPAITGKRQ